jgi:dCTP deaminase
LAYENGRNWKLFLVLVLAWFLLLMVQSSVTVMILAWIGIVAGIFAFTKTGKYTFDPRGERDILDYTKKTVVKEGKPFVLKPGAFVLASTIEWVEIGPALAGRLGGRSSLSRLGISVHQTAGMFHPGWYGRVVMEIKNLGPAKVLLWPGTRVCSMAFEQVSQEVEVPYSQKPDNKYAGQTGPM